MVTVELRQSPLKNHTNQFVATAEVILNREFIRGSCLEPDLLWSNLPHAASREEMLGCFDKVLLRARLAIAGARLFGFGMYH